MQVTKGHSFSLKIQRSPDHLAGFRGWEGKVRQERVRQKKMGRRGRKRKGGMKGKRKEWTGGEGRSPHSISDRRVIFSILSACVCIYAPWFCSFRLWRFTKHLLTYLLTYFRLQISWIFLYSLKFCRSRWLPSRGERCEYLLYPRDIGAKPKSTPYAIYCVYILKCSANCSVFVQLFSSTSLHFIWLLACFVCFYVYIEFSVRCTTLLYCLVT